MAGLNQMNRFRKESNTLKSAAKKGYSQRDLVFELTKDMHDPDSASTVGKAAAIVDYLAAVNDKATPVADALARLEANAKDTPVPDSGPIPA
ncbi:MAG: hypothetical protein ACR2PX_25075 [Endozoicomonas sp.]|uniref:hypothetical protein n=1 Tax=Endozoicomonas sp. TaxID=1892382 RepID=UPI003D9B7EB0